MATYEIVSVSPVRVRSKLLELLGDSLVSETESGGEIVRWEPEEYRWIRTDAPDLIDALDGRSLEPVLQRAGAAMLHELGTVHSLRLVALARRCVAGLRERDWPGDEPLADDLDRALGDKTGESELLPTSIDLESLVEALDTDPAEGVGAFDPLTGDVLSGLLMSSGDFDEDEDSELEADVPRIDIVPGSQGAYLDMAHFADTVAEPRVRERLQEALNGRGAFRRFKDAIHDVDGDTLSAWTIFSEERSLGRARQWLADHGYRPKA